MSGGPDIYSLRMLYYRNSNHKLNMKMLLYTFEMMSDHKINYLESETITIGGDL
jgi:hypothetical protein